jgi:hypothetical protein
MLHTIDTIVFRKTTLPCLGQAHELGRQKHVPCQTRMNRHISTLIFTELRSATTRSENRPRTKHRSLLFPLHTRCPNIQALAHFTFRNKNFRVVQSCQSQKFDIGRLKALRAAGPQSIGLEWNGELWRGYRGLPSFSRRVRDAEPLSDGGDRQGSEDGSTTGWESNLETFLVCGCAEEDGESKYAGISEYPGDHHSQDLGDTQAQTASPFKPLQNGIVVREQTPEN